MKKKSLLLEQLHPYIFSKITFTPCALPFPKPKKKILFSKSNLLCKALAEIS